VYFNKIHIFSVYFVLSLCILTINALLALFFFVFALLIYISAFSIALAWRLHY
jgi:hypothetical protein